MPLLVPVREQDREMFVLATFLATLAHQAQRREFYLALATELELERMLEQFATGDRNIMRACGCALYHAFTSSFPSGDTSPRVAGSPAKLMIQG